MSGLTLKSTGLPMFWKGDESIMPKNAVRFMVTLKSGDKVNVTYSPNFLNHLEFRGNVSETGYRSEFPFPVDSHPSLDEVKTLAGEIAQKLYDDNPAKYGTQQPLF
ncbi:MAG: hypothetical protein PHH57_02760 [Candidatus Omnitrophica bacterium]|nr:hypothetical protein [Candidatus Omnitrophota bacterium]